MQDKVQEVTIREKAQEVVFFSPMYFPCLRKVARLKLEIILKFEVYFPVPKVGFGSVAEFIQPRIMFISG